MLVVLHQCRDGIVGRDALSSRYRAVSLLIFTRMARYPKRRGIAPYNQRTLEPVAELASASSRYECEASLSTLNRHKWRAEPKPWRRLETRPGLAPGKGRVAAVRLDGFDMRVIGETHGNRTRTATFTGSNAALTTAPPSIPLGAGQAGAGGWNRTSLISFTKRAHPCSATPA